MFGYSKTPRGSTGLEDDLAWFITTWGLTCVCIGTLVRLAEWSDNKGVHHVGQAARQPVRFSSSPAIKTHPPSVSGVTGRVMLRTALTRPFSLLLWLQVLCEKMFAKYLPRRYLEP